jgi:predicted nucleic acid-binding Zn ribbon protein
MNRQRDRGHSWLGIRDILSQSLKQVDVDAKVSSDWAGLCWVLAVGKEIAKISHVTKVAPKTLYVEVTENEWIPPLEVLKDKIIREMRQQAGLEGLTQIRFKATPVSDSGENRPSGFMKKNTRSNANSGVGQRASRESKRRTGIKKT